MALEKNESGVYYRDLKDGRVFLRRSKNGYAFRMAVYYNRTAQRIYTLTGYVESIEEFESKSKADILRMLDNEGYR